MSPAFDSFSRPARVIVSMILMAFTGGCGYSEYEFRLNESKKYYAYLDKIEKSLAPKWSLPGNLMELRVPSQFNPIPGPPPPGKDEERPQQPIDHRQPDYVNLTFPGLFGAWDSNFKVSKTDGTAEDRRGFIYALSNYWEFAGEHATDAGAFTTKVKDLLAEKLRIQESDVRNEQHPKLARSYKPQVTYEAFSFKGKDIDGINYSFDVYSRTQGSIIGVIVVVLPDSIDQKVSERIPMMLETFNFTRVPPKVGADQNAPQQNVTTPVF